MKAKFMAILEDKMQEFVNEICEDDDAPDMWYPENCTILMAQAAATIIDACVAEKNHIETQT